MAKFVDEILKSFGLVRGLNKTDLLMLGAGPGVFLSEDHSQYWHDRLVCGHITIRTSMLLPQVNAIYVIMSTTVQNSKLLPLVCHEQSNLKHCIKNWYNLVGTFCLQHQLARIHLM